jgi:hypothetical protein
MATRSTSKRNPMQNRLGGGTRLRLQPGSKIQKPKKGQRPISMPVRSKKPHERQPPDPNKLQKAETVEEAEVIQKQAESPYTSTQLQEFDPLSVKLDSFVFVVGKRRYGKTIWSRWLLGENRKFFQDGIYVFTTTKHN